MTVLEREAERTREVERYATRDTLPEEDFDAIARLAAAICNTPVGLVTVVYGERQWFKGRIGTALDEVPRNISFCTHALEAPNQLLVVEDARSDARFVSNPLVTGEPFVRFYAGMPVLSRDGIALGTVCVLDVTPRTISATQSSALRTLAKQASAQFELRRVVRELAERQETADNYKLLERYAGDVVLFVRPSDARIVDASSGAAAAYGYSIERLRALRLDDVRLPQAHSLRSDPTTGPSDDFRAAVHRRSDGSTYPVEVATIATLLNGQPVDMLVVRDTAERKAREQQSARYRLLAERAHDIILFSRCSDRRIIEANAAACAAYGYTEDEMRSMNISQLRPPGAASDFDVVYPAIEHADLTYVSVHQRKDGSTFPAEVAVHVAEVGGENVVFAIIRDISERVALAEAAGARKRALEASNAALVDEIAERKAAEARLAHVAFHDHLTGLPNRALFVDRLKHMVARLQRRSDHQSAILVLDVDRFKSINDGLGHVVGDLVLIAIARRLERCLRTGDTFARLGGDEFGVLLDGIGDEHEATRFADRILRELRPPFSIPHHGDVFVSASIGVVVSRTGYDLPDDLMRSADVAMYRAKAEGKQRSQLFRSELLTSAAGILQLETDLNLALERQEFRLVYQPIVTLADGAITGFEALLRWQHPERGLVGPVEFIAVAEETGIIVPIGEWVLHEACRQVSEWHAAYPQQQHLSVNVNVSAKQISSRPFVAYVRDTLSAHSVCVQNLQLEITETALMSDGEAATSLLKELRTLGMPVHLDDFGTGYSSLAYLHRFPVDTLKIDRSFVSGAGKGLANPEIVQTVIALAKSLAIDTIAEGIETREQLAGLRALGCSRGQGYYFSRPLDAPAATALLAAGLPIVPVTHAAPQAQFSAGSSDATKTPA